MKKKKLMLEEHITAALLLVMLTILGVNIITRILFGWSLAFTEEVVVYLFAICSMVGAAAACAHGANMGLSALTDLMPRKIQAVFLVLSAILSVFLFGVILKQGITTTMSMIHYAQKTPIMRIPTWIFELWYPIGAVCYIFRVLVYTKDKLKEVLTNHAD